MRCEIGNPGDPRPASGRADWPRATPLTAIALSLLLIGLPARGESQAPGSAGNRVSSVTPDPARPEIEDTLTVAPALERFTRATLLGDVWKRPDLSPRDRSLVTVAALVARGQTAEMPYEIDRALDNGVTPGEASEALTQLAFYAGWPKVFSALPVVKGVFEKRP